MHPFLPLQSISSLVPTNIMDRLAAYLSQFQNSSCLCRTIASIKSFTVDLLIETRPYLDEEQRNQAVDDLIKQAIQAMEKKNNKTYTRSCCMQQKIGKSPEVNLSSKGNRITTDVKKNNVKQSSPTNRTINNTRQAVNKANVSQDTKYVRNNSKINSVAVVAPIVRASSALTKPSNNLKSKDLSSCKNNIEKSRYEAEKNQKRRTAVNSTRITPSLPKCNNKAVFRERNTSTQKKQKSWNLFSEFKKGESLEIKVNEVLSQKNSSVKPEKTTRATCDKKIEIETPDQDVNETMRILTKLLKCGVNITLNIFIHSDVSNEQEDTKDPLKYVTKPPVNVMENTKFNKAVDTDIYMTKLDELETPKRLSTISRELENLSEEFVDMQATVDRLLYGEREDNGFYLWDEFV